MHDVAADIAGPARDQYRLVFHNVFSCPLRDCAGNVNPALEHRTKFNNTTGLG
jgi:hypothetical protein